MRGATRAILIAAVLGGAACTADVDGSDDATAADTGAAAANPTTEVAQVTLMEWSVELSTDTLPAGAVTFQIANRGDYAHAFAMQGVGEEWSVDDVASGQDATLRVELAPGIYDIYCPVQDAEGSHESRGMRAQLVVIPTSD